MNMPVTCATLANLDSGASGVIIDAAIREAVRDLDDRGGEDGKPRKVVIELTLKPLDNGQCAVHVFAQAKIPPRNTAGTIGAIRSKADRPELFFNDLATRDPSQRTIDEVEE